MSTALIADGYHIEQWSFIELQWASLQKLWYRTTFIVYFFVPYYSNSWFWVCPNSNSFTVVYIPRDRVLFKSIIKKTQTYLINIDWVYKTTKKISIQNAYDMKIYSMVNLMKLIWCCKYCYSLCFIM